MSRKKKLVLVISHPIQYHAPLYRVIANKGLFDLHVIYHNDRGVRPYFDKFANTWVNYDNDLLNGYSYQFLTRGEPRGTAEKVGHRWLPSLMREIDRARPDAVYFHGYTCLGHIRAIFRMRKKGIKVFFRGENEDVLERPFWRHAAREALLRLLIPRFDAVLFIGKANKEFFLKRGVPESRLFFVPYSADNEYFGIGLEEAEVRATRQCMCAEYRIPEDSVIFMNTCKHRPEKRPMDVLHGFIRAFGNVASSKAVLVLVGDGPLNSEMRNIAAASKARIVFTGFVNQSKMRNMLLSADFLVNPGAEPWGCVFNEALPAGLGLISSDKVVGHPDMIRPGENGFVFGVGDVDALAAVMRKCSEFGGVPPSFRLISKQLALKYSYDTCVTGMQAALESTCGNV